MIIAERLWEIEEFIQGDEIVETQTAMTKSDSIGKALASTEIPESWGTESVSTKDVAPTFLSIDPKTGEIKKSTNGEVLATTAKGIDVIPVKHIKEHQYVDVNGKTHMRQPYEENLKSGEKIMWNGIEVERVTSHIFFFLISGREHEGVVVYSARKTSRWACEKTLLPHILGAKRLNKSIAEQAFNFRSEMKINEAKQKYFVCHFEPSHVTTKEQKALAYLAWKELSASADKIADMDDGVTPF